MARACASGALYHCTCAENPKDQYPVNENFQWGGCGDNLKWGARFAKRFIDNVEKDHVQKTKEKLKRDNRASTTTDEDLNSTILRNQMAVVNLHNNKVGRRVG